MFSRDHRRRGRSHVSQRIEEQRVVSLRIDMQARLRRRGRRSRQRVVDEFVGEIGEDRGLVGARGEEHAGGDERRQSNEGSLHWG